MVIHLLIGVVIVATTFNWRSQASRARVIQWWSQRLLKVLGIEVQLIGVCPGHYPGNTVLVSNHISWIDIFVINAKTVSRFVAKAEVRDWPLIGWLSLKTGTLFITREKRQDTVKVNQQVATALAEGDCIAIFPEGSTTDGRTLRAFNSSLLQPAVSSGATVIPVAIRYRTRAGDYTDAAAYVDDMSLVDSMRRLAATRVIIAELEFLPAHTGHSNRRQLTRDTEAAIKQAIHPHSAKAVVATAPNTPHHPPAALP
jgi:1-acyl-sn-glycerol-3-phosphate acyltransferase